jgi:uncharacterized protein YydD (DUF2326 family)
MKPELLKQFLENKVEAIKAKMEVIKSKDMMDIYKTLGSELVDTQIAIAHLDKAMQDIHYYTNQEVKEKMKQYLLEEIPDLAMYFKKESIDKVISDSIKKAFERVSDEHFKNRIVNLVE